MLRERVRGGLERVRREGKPAAGHPQPPPMPPRSAPCARRSSRWRKSPGASASESRQSAASSQQAVQGGCEPMRADDRRRPTKPIKIRLSLALRDHEESFQARSRLAVGETAETLPQPARDPVADTGHKA
jgi:hypothetical protein